MDINEYNKYKNDKIKFASKFFQCVNPRRGKIVKASLYEHQKVILKADDNLLVKKARQVGVTEALAFEIAYHLNYTRDYNMLVYCATKNQLDYMKDKVARHFSNIPDNIRVGQTASFKLTFVTDINSCVEFRSGDASTLGHSQTYDAIYAEEVDFIKDFDNSYNVLAQSMSRKGKMVLTTTPITPKQNNTFHRLWNAKNKFNKLSITSKSHSYNSTFERDLNALTKEQYDKIINECIII